MNRKNKTQLHIAWIIPTVGCFGAVREMVEVSNGLIELGHRVTIYHPTGESCKWLECGANFRKLAALSYDTFDVLIGIVDWQPQLYQDLLQAKAKVKAICLLGFSPTEEMAQALRGERESSDEAQRMIYDAMQRKFLILADSNWQIEWVKQKVGYPAGPAFGGINLRMFKPPAAKDKNKIPRILYSGDPRKRKGTDTVEKAIQILKDQSFEAEYDSYWGKKFSQQQLVEFLQQGDIFLDGHRRAGWCNPVAEAIACGVVPVCTDIGAIEDFALHGMTALVVPVDDAERMAIAVKVLIADDNLRATLAANGLNHIQNYSYQKVVPVLERVLLRHVYA